MTMWTERDLGALDGGNGWNWMKNGWKWMGLEVFSLSNASAANSANQRDASSDRMDRRIQGGVAIRSTLTVAEAAAATGANRNTIKDKLRELVRAGIAELVGKGRGAHYRQRKGRLA